MKKILVIVDGIVAKRLMQRIVEANTGENSYDVIYLNDVILPVQKPSNFTFYKFDPTSKSKLAMVLDKNVHTEVLAALNTKDEMLNVIKNIREHKENLQINILDYWGIKVEDEHVYVYRGIDVLANGMVEKLPNIPVVAQNIGLKQGEIMEIRIPFGSSYAYRYIGSIEQNEWKIFGLYRNQKMVNVKPSFVIKPNDIILVIGKPKVLMQVYNAIGKTQGQFPMPFGHNLYLFLDLYLENMNSVKKAIQEAKYLNQRLKNSSLIVKITRPTTVDIMTYIKDELRHNPSIKLIIDYANLGFKKNIKEDFRKFDIGMMMLTLVMFQDKKKISKLIDMKVPIYKIGLENLKSVKQTVVVLNDTHSYEQISPMIFDVASQIKTKIKIFDLDPIGSQKDKSNLLDHFENLSKIFNEKIEIVSNGGNPIRELSKEENLLHIMPLKKDMFNERYSFKFLYTNSDLLSFDKNKNNQLLIPISEENDKE
ncbi:MAG: TrkA C-terminal domain-containing protein [Sulfurovum sp.]|jgi:hypothetical protein